MKFGVVLAFYGAVVPVLAGTHEVWYVFLLSLKLIGAVLILCQLAGGILPTPTPTQMAFMNEESLVLMALGREQLLHPDLYFRFAHCLCV